MNRLYLFIGLLLSLAAANAGGNWLSKMVLDSEKGNAIDNSRKTHEVTNQGFFRDHVLVLFYSSSCPHCHEFAPKLNRWAVTHEARVLPLSFDNKPLPEFPDFLPATRDWVNVAFADRPISYPALFVINNKTNVLYPVSVGFMEIDELEARMHVLVPKIQSYEKRGAS